MPAARSSASLADSRAGPSRPTARLGRGCPGRTRRRRPRPGGPVRPPGGSGWPPPRRCGARRSPSTRTKNGEPGDLVVGPGVARHHHGQARATPARRPRPGSPGPGPWSPPPAGCRRAGPSRAGSPERLPEPGTRRAARRQEGEQRQAAEPAGATARASPAGVTPATVGAEVESRSGGSGGPMVNGTATGPAGPPSCCRGRGRAPPTGRRPRPPGRGAPSGCRRGCAAARPPARPGAAPPVPSTTTSATTGDLRVSGRWRPPARAPSRRPTVRSDPRRVVAIARPDATRDPSPTPARRHRRHAGGPLA